MAKKPISPEERKGTVRNLPQDRGDRRASWYEYFQNTRGRWALELLAAHPEIIDEHARNPLSEKGPMSAPLEALLNYFRTNPSLGGLFVYATVPWREFRLARLTDRAREPEIISDVIYGGELEAAHGVFLKRIELIKETYGAK